MMKKSENSRKGRIGTWKSIDQAYREDGRRFLFIQGIFSDFKIIA